MPLVLYKKTATPRPREQVGLYKTFVCLFGGSALVHTILGIQHLLYCTLPPSSFAINIAQCMVSPRPPCVAIQHPILVMAISCKGQRTRSGGASLLAATGRPHPPRGAYHCQVQERAAYRKYYLSAKIVQSISGSLLDRIPPRDKDQLARVAGTTAAAGSIGRARNPPAPSSPS